ncbi:MAG: quinone-interacting membrane-bound oxidoreductase complex subunit QmoC [Nitrospinae bacterium]|nr:quinone-interacting membrane-bound oxidoreductase complex subunit QmoC [Nitrospinota bacterium]
MDQAEYLEPDLAFIARLKRAGGEDVKKCFQCATCTVVCDVTQSERPFPRKEMIWAQWGLKGKLFYNPDVWLCHQCGDCTAHCPRGAKPSEVLAAVRDLSFAEHAVPGFLGRMHSSPAALVALFALPVAVLLLAALYANGLAIPEGEIVYSRFFPLAVIDSIFIPAALFALIASALGVKKFWGGMKRNNPEKGAPDAAAVIGAVKDILFHKKFAQCRTNRPRYTGHLLAFFGFLALFATTNLVMLYHYLLGRETPLALGDPVKLLGNAGALAAFAGVSYIIARRLAAPEETGKASYRDWAFILTLYAAVITGILAESARLADIPAAAYPVYFTHLVFVFFLIAYLPFSKFAHMLYRTAAMIYAASNGKTS